MNITKKQNGYTIVETMIVLAVTGAMLTATVVLISGQIERYRFKEITYNSQQAVQNAINDVQFGYFDLANSPPTGAPCSGGDSSKPGDSNCVYAGKKIEITASGQLVTTPILIEDTDSPFDAGVIPFEGMPPQTTQLPGGVEYSPMTFYVMFNNYQDTSVDFTSDKGGSQTVSIYSSAKGAPLDVTNNTNIVCLTGSKTAKLVIGANSTKEVELKYEACP